SDWPGETSRNQSQKLLAGWLGRQAAWKAVSEKIVWTLVVLLGLMMVSWGGRSSRYSIPLAASRIGSDTSRPNPSSHMPAITWKVMYSCSKLYLLLRKLIVRSPQSGGMPTPIDYPSRDSFTEPRALITRVKARVISSGVTPGRTSSKASS